MAYFQGVEIDVRIRLRSRAVSNEVESSGEVNARRQFRRRKLLIWAIALMWMVGFYLTWRNYDDWPGWVVAICIFVLAVLTPGFKDLFMNFKTYMALQQGRISDRSRG